MDNIGTMDFCAFVFHHDFDASVAKNENHPHQRWNGTTIGKKKEGAFVCAFQFHHGLGEKDQGAPMTR